MEGSDYPLYEGSHVCIFDSIENPTKIVLSWNKRIGHIETPGSGKRGERSFEQSAIDNTKKQTGLDVYDLELLSDWDYDGKPFKEREDLTQYVRIQNFLARGVEPSDPDEIERRIEQHRQTEEGRIYQPTFTEICKLSEVKGLYSGIPEMLKERFGV